MSSTGFFVYGQHTLATKIPVVIALTVTCDFVMHRYGDFYMLEYVFVAVFKHTPYMISTAATCLSATFVESNVICIGHENSLNYGSCCRCCCWHSLWRNTYGKMYETNGLGTCVTTKTVWQPSIGHE